MLPSATSSRFPVPTLRCWILLFIAIASFATGYLTDDKAAMQVGWFLMVMATIGWLVAWFNFRSFEYHREEPDQVFAQERFPVTVTLATQRLRVGAWSIEVEDELLGNGRFFQSSEPRFRSDIAESLVIPELAPGRSVTCEYLAAVARRGVYQEFRYRISSSFPFGLYTCSRSDAFATQITVFPQPEYLHEHENISFAEATGEREVFRPISDTSGELRGLREFVHGDALRMVHWRASAKYNNFVVREFEPTTPENVSILYHSVRQGLGHSRPAREQCLQLLAGMLIELDEAGARTELIAGFNNWQTVVVDERPGSLDDALTTLARARIRSEKDMKQGLAFLRELPEQHHRIIVVSDTPLRFWAEQLAEFPGALLVDNDRMVLAGHYAEAPS